MEKLIKISINNWCRGRDYPDTEFFDSMIDDVGLWKFDKSYCEENKICAYDGCWDMSENLVMVAPKSWVDKNCPELLTNEKYRKRFVYDENAEVDRFGFSFPNYPFGDEKPTEYGLYFQDNGYGNCDDEDENDE